MPYVPLKFISSLAILIVISLSPASAFGQSFWVEGDRHKTVSLEMLRPDFVGKDETTVPTAAWFLSIRWPLGKGALLLGELPFSHYGNAIDNGETESRSIIGNPYIAVELPLRELPIFVELGVRAPLVSGDEPPRVYVQPAESDGQTQARRIGTFSDLSRTEAFALNRLTITAIIKRRIKTEFGVGFCVYGGPRFSLSTTDHWQDRSELLFSYGALAWFDEERASVRVGFFGQVILTESELPFSSDAHVHQMTFGARFRVGKVHPGFNFSLPFNDDIGNTLEYVFGLNVTLQLD